MPLANFTLSARHHRRILPSPAPPRPDAVGVEVRFLQLEELTKIVKHRAKALQWQLDESLPPLIAQRARGTPRLALRLLKPAGVCAVPRARSRSPCDHLSRACDLEHLDDLGLGPLEQRYLKSLAEGASRLNVLASMLGFRRGRLPQ